MSIKPHLSSLNVEAFKKWLHNNGHEVLSTTMDYEVVRFKNSKGVGIIYKNKSNLLTITGQAVEALQKFKGNHSYKAECVNKRKIIKVKTKTLLERDGDECFYCGHPLGEDITKEHVLSIGHGGTNHIANLALAHGECNKKANNLSIVEKIKLRDSLRGYKK